MVVFACATHMQCQDALLAAPSSAAQKGCSRTIWAAAQRGQCSCLFTDALCAKDTLPDKNSLWVHMRWLKQVIKLLTLLET